MVQSEMQAKGTDPGLPSHDSLDWNFCSSLVKESNLLQKKQDSPFDAATFEMLCIVGVLNNI